MASGEGEGDLFVESDAKLVLIAGKTHCRALKLEDGKTMWKVETGPPTGRGVRMGKNYYLPVKGSIVTLDLAKGTITGRVIVPGGKSPGNLVWHQELVLSQSATALTAFARVPPR